MVATDHEGEAVTPRGTGFDPLVQCQHVGYDCLPRPVVTGSQRVLAGARAATTVHTHARPDLGAERPAGRPRPSAPVHRRARHRDRDHLAGPVGTRGHVPGTQPVWPPVGRLRARRRHGRSSTCWTCSRTRRAQGSTWATRWATSARTSTAATCGWPATTSCTRWVTTPSGSPPSSTPSQTGTHPRVTTEANIAIISAQLRRLGLAHDDRRRVATTDVGFYRWTQWIFLQLFGSWYDPDRDGPGRSPSSRQELGRRHPGARPRHEPVRPILGRPRRGGAPAGRRRPSARVPARGARQLVPRRWERCSPTRRSPPTAAPSAATSRCSGGRSSSG